MVDPGRVGIVGGVVQLQHRAVVLVDAVDHRGGGDDEVEVELALEPLLDDLEMQQAQEAAAEAQAQSAELLSGSYSKLASLRRSLPRLSRRFS